MNRWHVLRGGRIVRTAWSSDGDCAARELRPDDRDMICSDADWWAMQHRRALRHIPLNWNPFRAEVLAHSNATHLPRLSLEQARPIGHRRP
jgi:hypothetical protein